MSKRKHVGLVGFFPFVRVAFIKLFFFGVYIYLKALSPEEDSLYHNGKVMTSSFASL